MVSGAHAESITERIVDAYGGSAAIERAHTIYMKATIKAFMRGDQGTYVRYLKRDGKLRVETQYSRSSELRVLNGKRGWRNMNKAPLAEAEGAPLMAMLYQYKEADLPYGLMKGLFTVSDEGRSKVGGVDVFSLGLEDADHIPMQIYVDTKSYRILRAEGYFLMGGGRATSLASEYGDFRKVDGLLLPFKITNYAAGQKISETKVLEYRLDVDMPERLFLP